MGFFSKMQGITGWSDEDLADESYKLSDLMSRSLRNTPWGDASKLDSHMAERNRIKDRMQVIDGELSRRGLTTGQIASRSLMRKLGK